MKKIILFIGLLYGLGVAGTVDVDAATPNGVEMRKIFDAFRSALPPPENRLREIKSSLTRMFIPLTGATQGYGDSLDVVKGEYPNFVYDFSISDSQWVEPVLAQGTSLNLGYCWMPAALNSDNPTGPPENYDAWEEFNYQWAKHHYEKYGITWYEIYNEPDYHYFFTGSRDDYFKMYKYAVMGIKRAVPDAIIGGPALAGEIGWVGPFLDYIQQNDLPIDFVSYHGQDNGFESLRYYKDYQDIIEELDQRGLNDVQVHLNEFSYEIDSRHGDEYDRSKCAAYYAGTFKHMLFNMPRLERFNKTIINNGDILGMWEYLGLIELDNTPKAKFNLFKMYAMLPDEGLQTEVTGDIDAMAAVNDSTVGVMVWNKTSLSQPLELNLKNIPFEAQSVQVYLIDPEHSSYWDNPASAELERVQQYEISGKSFSDTTTMREYSVYLYLISSEKVTALRQREGGKSAEAESELLIYPNPFNQSARIEFTLQQSADITITLHDNRGRIVKTIENGRRSSGTHSLSYDAAGLASGIYWLQIKGSEIRRVKKIVLLR